MNEFDKRSPRSRGRQRSKEGYVIDTSPQSRPVTTEGSFLGSPPAEMASLASGLAAPTKGLPIRETPAPTSATRTPKLPATAEASLEAAVFATFGPEETQPIEAVEETEPTDRLKEAKRWVIELAIWIVASLVLTSLLRLFVFQMFLVPSGSMENTLQVGDRIAALKVTKFQRGDIVVFSDPANWLAPSTETVSSVRRFFEYIGLFASSDQQYLVKRVIGLPGDHVECCNMEGQLIVNGVAINEESYIKDPFAAASGIFFDIIVPADRVFVMGDNRYNSADSRFHLCQDSPDGFGMSAFVPFDNIVGPVRAVVMPFSRTGHRALPTAVFGSVPEPAAPPPDKAVVSVTGGFYEDCHS